MDVMLVVIGSVVLKSTELELGDALLNAGVVLLAALIGVAGLLLANQVEQWRRQQAESDLAFVHLMHAIGAHALRCEAWLSEPSYSRNLQDGSITSVFPKDRNTTFGGPIDVELQTTVDIAVLEATKRDRAVALQLAETLFHFKRARTAWQIGRFGEIVGDIRKWKTGDMSERDFVDKLRGMQLAIQAQEETFARAGS
ncbi:hypothetical protein [Ruicaihuangia caeni]|uniref:DUF4760 domain-containing protein n=1 Tax=Ruicaihuangia caeni TaxID=3042517 RepID=A0AAW6T6Z0_9MICO|nr:hypothetical protein [Klugiella sp. YN-L-19]MDI2099562.1 hypothetical protein [Klugiella sp. YN-L-19]